MFEVNYFKSKGVGMVVKCKNVGLKKLRKLPKEEIERRRDAAWQKFCPPKALKIKIHNKVAGKITKVVARCFDCSHECKLDLKFSNSDSIEYIKAVVGTFVCPVVVGSDCKWSYLAISSAEIK